MAPEVLLKGGKVVLPDGQIDDASVLLANGQVEALGAGLESSAGAEAWDASGLTLAPGFMDVHVHGGGGFSLITTNRVEIQEYARWAVSHGVTSFVATICADSTEDGIEYVRSVASAVGPIGGGATLLGLNLEGPFVSPDRSGALPPDWIAPSDLPLLGRILAAGEGTIRIMTIAPELVGAEAVIKAVLDAGVAVSVGHTDARYDQASAAFESGATHVTHAFNAMRPLHHRDPGPIGAALASPGVTIEVIADGVHLHPATVSLCVRAFGPERVCLVTDAVRPAGLDSGTFRIGGHDAVMDRGSIRLPDGTIAGSAATMDAVVRNLVSWGAVGVVGAVAMASATPARAMGLGDRKGAIAPGYDADIVALDGDLNVVATWVGGALVYER
jgi:N-acetylglucosamine-6-phosphate deacetylase